MLPRVPDDALEYLTLPAARRDVRGSSRATPICSVGLEGALLDERLAVTEPVLRASGRPLDYGWRYETLLAWATRIALAMSTYRRRMSLPLFHRTPARGSVRRAPPRPDSGRRPANQHDAELPLAIVQYPPTEEFELRGEVQRLTADLAAHGWIVLSINLQSLLLDRVRAQGAHWAERVIAMETRTASRDPARGLNYLKSKLTPLVEGPTASPPTAAA